MAAYLLSITHLSIMIQGNYTIMEIFLMQRFEGFDVICIVLENSGKLAWVNLLF